MLICFLLNIQLIGFGQLQRKADEPIKPTRILFLLDGSGSMLSEWEGGTRMDKAKELLTYLVDSLAAKNEVQLALRVYGHQYIKKFQNCQDTKLEVPFTPNNHEQIKAKLKAVQPKGVTPLSYSLEQATSDFQESRKYRNVIIIITDGIESCDGDPCAVSQKLQRKHIFLKPFIIGIGMDNKLGQEFHCMGQFYNVHDTKSFKRILNKVVAQTMSKALIRVDLLNEQGKATETNVNMSFVNRSTGQTEYDFVHFIKPNGVADNLEVDPILDYDLIIYTVPPVIKRNIRIDDPKLNIIKVKTPRGTLQVSLSGYNEYGTLPILIKKKGSPEIIHTIQEGEKTPLLTGSYDIEILTLPRIKKEVKISQDKNSKINIFAPGILNIADRIDGYGSVYSIDKNGKEEWIYDLPEFGNQTSITIQPGKYKLVFRSRNASGSIHTLVKTFKINAGSATKVSLLR